MSGESGKRVRVYRVARSPSVDRGDGLSSDPVARSMELRFVAFALFLLLTFGALGVRKLQRAVGTCTLAGAGGLVGLLVLGALLKRRSATRESEDEESQLLPEEVVARMEAGLLAPTDLVHEGQTWVTLLESLQFGEAARPSHARIALRERIKLGTFILVGSVMAVGAFIAAFNLREVLEWLTDD